MVLVAVVIGYVLGIAPFLLFYIVKRNNEKVDIEEYKNDLQQSKNETEEIINEWVYGESKDINKDNTNEGTRAFNEFMGVANNG